MDGGKCVGAVVCKLDMHKNMVRRGYIAMLAVEKEYRRHKIGEPCLCVMLLDKSYYSHSAFLHACVEWVLTS